MSIDTVLLVAILVFQVLAAWTAHKERARLLLAALSRTPAEYQELVRSVRRGGRIDP